MMNNKTNFTDMVHSILGESCLSRSIKKVLTESSLSRVMRHRNEHDTGCITAFRYNISKQKGMELTSKLNKILQSKGYGTTFVDGFYQEQEMDSASKEKSLFVVDLKDDGKLKQTLIELGSQFGQESILFKPKDGQARLIRTTKAALGKESNPASKTEWGKHTSAAWTQVNGRDFGDKIDIPSSFWNDNEEDEEEDYNKTAIFNGVFEHLQNLVSRRSEFSKYSTKQLKNALTKVLQDEKLPPNPNDEEEMYTYARMRIKPIYQLLLNSEEEEQELPKVSVKGTEILYNKRGRACGIKVSIIDFGTLYMKRRGSKWEISDISKEQDDERVWELVTSSLEKMAKKNPTTFIRLMRNRAYELPKFKPTTLGESVTVRGLEVTPQDIQRRTSGLTIAQIQQWLDAHDNTEFASMPDIVYSIENGETKEQMMGRAFGKVKTAVYSWLNLTEDNPQVDDIIMKHLQTSKVIPTTNKSVREFIDTFWADELKQFQQPKIIPQEQSK